MRPVPAHTGHIRSECAAAFAQYPRPLIDNPLHLIGIIRRIVILRPLKGGFLHHGSTVSLEYLLFFVTCSPVVEGALVITLTSRCES